jgi:HEAT repeat protein
MELLKDPDHEVLRPAIEALGDLGDRNAYSALREKLDKACKNIDDNVQDACAAEIAIGKIGGAQTATGKGRDEYARVILTYEICSWGLDKMFIFGDIREGAIEGLGFLHDRRAIKLLELILKDKLGQPYKVRECAATALADIAGRDAAPVLKQVAIDREERRDVRGVAAIGYAQVMNGEVDDMRIVRAIIDYPSPSGCDAMAPLSAMFKHGKTKAVRLTAAMGIVTYTGGEVDDVTVVEAIGLAPEDPGSKGSLLAIARRGKTEAVRAAAQRYLSKNDLEPLRKGLLVTPHDVSKGAKEK